MIGIQSRRGEFIALKSGICTTCWELREGTTCPRCGASLAVTRAAIEAWEEARQDKRVAFWSAEGIIDDATAQKMRAAIRSKKEKSEAPPPPVADVADEPVVKPSFFGEMSSRYAKVIASIETDAPKEEEEDAPDSERHRGASADAGRAVFGGGAVVAAGVEALDELDQDEGVPPQEAKPLGALQVFWFIGTILVLAGSLMGVREAWRSLEGALRPLSIAGALFAYHVVFVGLARLLARRSAVTGRVLGVIATGLLPVAFVAVAVAAGMSTSVSYPVALALLVASGVTLTLLGRRVFPGTGAALALGLVPALALEVPLAPGGDVTSRRLFLPLLALAPLALAAVRARFSITQNRSALLAFGATALYGAFAVAVFAFYGGPNDPTLSMSVFGPAPLALTAWLAAIAGTVWWALADARETGIAAMLPRAAAPIALFALALLCGGAITATITSLSADRAPLLAAGALAYAPPIVVLLTAVALAIEPRARRLSIHLAVPIGTLAIFLAARTMIDTTPNGWAASCAIVPVLLLLWSPYAKGPGRRFAVPTWGILSGAIVFLITLGADAASVTTYAPTLSRSLRSLAPIAPQVGLAIAIAAHAGGRTSRPGLHVFGAIAAFSAGAAYFVPIRPEPWWIVVEAVFAGLAGIYGVIALAYDRFEPATAQRPLDDASLGFAIAGVWFGLLTIPVASTFGAIETRPALPLLAIACVLGLRAFRDRSLVVSTHAGLALAIAAHVILGVATSGQGVLVSAACAGFLLVPAAFRSKPAADAERFGRPIFGVIPLPFGAQGRAVLDGYGIAALAVAALAYARGMTWIVLRAAPFDPLDAAANALESERVLVVFGAIGLVLAGLVAFSTRALDRVNARGNVGALVGSGLAIALAAVGNRIGHPLPPAVVGFKLSLVAVGVWLVARIFVRFGPAVAKRLERPAHGAHYHYVPHAGVLALGFLLLVDAVFVGGPTLTRAIAVTPPTLLLGGAVAMLLLHRSSGSKPFLHAGFAALLGFAVLASAQQAVLGPELVPLTPPGSRWMFVSTANAALQGDWLDPRIFLRGGELEITVWSRALAGFAIFGIACAGMLLAVTRVPAALRAVGTHVFGRPEDQHGAFVHAFAIWTTASCGVLALVLSQQPTLVPSLLLLGAGVLAVMASRPLHRVVAIGLAAPIVIHAVAHLTAPAPTPEWAGPAMACLALVTAAFGSWESRRRGDDPAVLVATQVAMLGYAVIALVYAFAASETMSPTLAMTTLVTNATNATDGSWAQTYAPGFTIGILAVASAIAAWSWRDPLGRIFAVFPPLVLGIAGAALATALVYTGAADVFPRTLTRDGSIVGLALAAAALVAHLAVHVHGRRGRADLVTGTAIGRDIALFSSAAVMSVFLLARERGGLAPGVFGVAAFAIAIVVSLDAMLRERTTRHVYLVEGLVLALYAFFTREIRPRPEIDALLGLGYGFTLLGITVVARRQKIPTVAVATRRFLVALPVLVAVLTSSGASGTSAAIALGASVLYGAIALTERSRIFGSLSAVAINVALLVFALAEGLDGIEIYVGPLGLLVAMLSQIFAPKLNHQARSAIRILGGVLLYLPSGLKLTLRLGAAEDATYSVVFGAVCLLGVVVGLVLRVRAYLALATIFLTLDVIANLVYVGLRDHRIGFVLLSASGLLILGFMILVTLRREAARGALDQLRSKLHSWD